MAFPLNTAGMQDPPNPAASPRKTPREKKDAYQAEINAMEARMKQMATSLRSLDERKSSSAAEAEEREKVKKIYDLFCDMAGYVEPPQFLAIGAQLDPNLTKDEFKLVLQWLGKDSASRLTFKDFYDWYEHKELLLAEHKKGNHPTREEWVKGKESSTPRDGSEKDKAEKRDKKDKKDKRLSRSRLSTIFTKKDEKKEEKKDDKKDKKDKKPDPSPRRTADPGTMTLSRSGNTPAKEEKGGSLLVRSPTATNIQSGTATLGRSSTIIVDKEAYKRQMLEKYEAQQRENVEILRKKKEEDAKKKAEEEAAAAEKEKQDAYKWALDEQRRAAEEQKRLEEELAALKAAQVAAKKKEEEDEINRKKREEEEIFKRRADEEEARRKKEEAIRIAGAEAIRYAEEEKRLKEESAQLAALREAALLKLQMADDREKAELLLQAKEATAKAASMRQAAEKAAALREEAESQLRIQEAKLQAERDAAAVEAAKEAAAKAEADRKAAREEKKRKLAEEAAKMEAQLEAEKRRRADMLIEEERRRLYEEKLMEQRRLERQRKREEDRKREEEEDTANLERLKAQRKAELDSWYSSESGSGQQLTLRVSAGGLPPSSNLLPLPPPPMADAPPPPGGDDIPMSATGGTATPPALSSPMRSSNGSLSSTPSSTTPSPYSSPYGSGLNLTPPATLPRETASPARTRPTGGSRLVGPPTLNMNRLPPSALAAPMSARPPALVSLEAKIEKLQQETVKVLAEPVPVARAPAIAERYKEEQSRLTPVELENAAMRTAEQQAQVLQKIASAVSSGSGAHRYKKDKEMAALRVENMRLQQEREDIRVIQEERARVEHERFLLEQQRLAVQKEHDALRKQVELDRQENAKRSQEQEELKKQLEAERLEKLRILREQHELKRQAATDRKTQLAKEEQSLQTELSAAPAPAGEAEVNPEDEEIKKAEARVAAKRAELARQRQEAEKRRRDEEERARLEILRRNEERLRELEEEEIMMREQENVWTEEATRMHASTEQDRRLKLVDMERRRREAEKEEAEALALLMKKDQMEMKMRDLEKQMLEKKRLKEEEEIRAQEERYAKLAEQLKALENTPTSPPPTLRKGEVKRGDGAPSPRSLALEEELASLDSLGGPTPRSARSDGKPMTTEEKMKAELIAKYDAEIEAKRQEVLAKEARVKEWEERGAKLESLMSKLNKLEMLDSLFEKLAAMPAQMQQAQRAAGAKPIDELKKEIQELQEVLFSETSSEKEKADANIKLEKAISAYEQMPEAKEDARRKKEDRRLRNEPLNKAALSRMKELYHPERIRGEPELLKRVGENPELRLLFMEPETILRLHQNDYKTYTMKNVSLDELRAIRALLPVFRQDQAIQRDWAEGLDDKIDSLAAQSTKPPVQKKETKKLARPKPNPAGGGDIFGELLARKGKLASDSTGGSRGSGGNPAPALQPPLPPSVPSFNAPPPAPPSAGGVPSQELLDSFDALDGLLDKTLAHVNKDEKEVAADTRNSVQEIKKLSGLLRAKNSTAAKTVEDSAADLVLAVKGILAGRKTNTVPAAHAALEAVVEQVKAKAGVAIM